MIGAQPPTDTARSMLRNFESFKPQAYWDVNHYRAGYGSDTITNPDGTVVPVTKDTVVTQADAERDLQRRTAQTTQQIQGQIGPAWNGMTPQAQASLVSVAYNYGELPQRVVTAAQTGDPAKLSQAVLDLGTDNGGVNANRRRFESELISGLKGDAYRIILNNPNLNTNEQAHAFDEIRRLNTAAEIATNANATAIKQANDQAMNGYVSKMINEGTATPQMLQQFASDPNLTPETKENLYRFATQDFGLEQPGQFGPAYTNAYGRIFLPPDDPNRITDANDILKLGAPGGGLTPRGTDRLMKVFADSRKNPDQASINTTKIALYDYAKSKLSFDQEMLFPGMAPLKDPVGAQAFNAVFVPKFESAYDAWMKAHPDKPYDFLTKDNVDKLMDGIRSPRDMAAARISATSEPIEIPEGPPPPPPEGINPAAWNGVLADRPKANGAPYPLDAWIKVVEMLRQDPSPRNIKLFDESQFGRAGYRGAEILNRLNAATELTPIPGVRAW